MSDESGTTFQSEHGHFRMKVGYCPFCRHDDAQLWYEPSEWGTPFQVRCPCGAAGPWCDCGEESAVPSWRSVGRITEAETRGRRAGIEEAATIAETVYGWSPVWNGRKVHDAIASRIRSNTNAIDREIGR